VGAEALSESERAVERQLHEDCGERAQPVAHRILVQEPLGGRQLPAELEREAVRGHERRHVGVSVAGAVLTLLGKLQRGPDVRGGVERPSAAPRCLEAES
jgi:hypothetical protein